MWATEAELMRNWEDEYEFMVFCFAPMSCFARWRVGE